MRGVSALKRSEIPAFCRLFRAVVQAVPYYSAEAKRRELAKYTPRKIAEKMKAGYVFLVAKEGSRLIGLCFAHHDDGLYWLDWYGVDGRYRRKGIAIALVKAMLARLNGKTHKIWCDSRTSNKESVALFEKLGFRKIAKLEKHWYGLDFYLWERRL